MNRVIQLWLSTSPNSRNYLKNGHVFPFDAASTAVWEQLNLLTFIGGLSSRYFTTRLIFLNQTTIPSLFVTYHLLREMFPFEEGKSTGQSFVKTSSSSNIKNVTEVLHNPGWFSVMQEKMSAQRKIETWDLCPLPPCKKAIGCKWVFIIKVHLDGQSSFSCKWILSVLWPWLLWDFFSCH